MKNSLGVMILLTALGSAAFADMSGKDMIPSETYGYFLGDKKTKTYSLKANEFLMKKPVKFRVEEVWKYDSEHQKWVDTLFKKTDEKTIQRREQQVYGRDSDQVVFPIVSSFGLFWVKWTEDGVPKRNFLYAGMLCNDVHIGPERKGERVATCIPGENQATAAYVPDPQIYCIKK